MRYDRRVRPPVAGPSADRESAAWSRLREYYQDPNTPRAHDVLLAAVGISAGELLLVRGIDDGNWELPGGVGVRGRGDVSSLFLGSVSYALIHKAACPVAVVRPD
jgi:hypothetical protein